MVDRVEMDEVVHRLEQMEHILGFLLGCIQSDQEDFVQALVLTQRVYSMVESHRTGKNIDCRLCKMEQQSGK